MNNCEHSMKFGAVIFLLLGLAFLFVDLGKWDFWGISWYTALFLVVGFFKLHLAFHPECVIGKKKK